MQIARRMQKIPPYLFADLDRKRAQLRAKGVDVISLAIGDPDLPTPDHIIEALTRAAHDPATHQYPPYEGTRQYRGAVADWYARRFGVTLDPESEVLALIGSKEGLAHVPWVFINPGDVALVSDPGYPVYATATVMAEGEPYPVPMSPERGWVPDLGAVPADIARRARVMFLNYPNNPTAGTADVAFFSEAVEFAKRWDVLIVHDNTYSEIGYDGYRPPSFLQAPGAKNVGIELHSLSKTYCMTGWRMGFAVGNRDAIQALGTLKTNIDSGQFAAVQAAGVAALTGPDGPTRERVAIWQKRRDMVVAGLRRVGLDVPRPRATFYLWVPVPAGYDSVGFTGHLLEQAGVVVTPGTGYGARGEGYVRISLTAPDDRFVEAIRRIGTALGHAPEDRPVESRGRR
ncbi:MAG TPA: LL-diaminopimelate aminotransferase [bacterium]|nr:LL-diaminopimelate aminotransferase [bacterium]